MKTLKERLLSHITIDQKTGCWNWNRYRMPTGYGQIGTEGSKPEMTHRVSWKLFKGPIPDGLWVLHKCDNPACVNPDHLFLGTHTDNMKDCVKKGRFRANIMYGENHPKHKLTVESVLAIRKDARPQWRIAKDYGVCEDTIYKVKNRRMWGHVPDPPTMTGSSGN